MCSIWSGSLPVTSLDIIFNCNIIINKSDACATHNYSKIQPWKPTLPILKLFFKFNQLFPYRLQKDPLLFVSSGTKSFSTSSLTSTCNTQKYQIYGRSAELWLKKIVSRKYTNL